MDYIKINGLSKNEVIGLVKEWIKLYPHSFNPDVNFSFYEPNDNQVVIGLHDDLSTLAVSLLVIYLTSAIEGEKTSDCVVAYVTVDDNEILLKQNCGRRAKITANSTDGDSTGVVILLENNYCVEYYFKGKAKPVKDSASVFEEPELVLGEDKDEVTVGEIIPKKMIEEAIEPETSIWKKLMWYCIFGGIGLGIGFLLTYLNVF